MNSWTDKGGTSLHVDGHKIGLFGQGWWIYPKGWPVVDAQGPFSTRDEAKERLNPENFQARATPYLFQVAPRFFQTQGEAR